MTAMSARLRSANQVGSKISQSRRVARWSREQFDAIAERSQFADHLAGPHLLCLHADRGAAFFVPNALVRSLPDQTTQPMGDGTDSLRVSKARDKPAVHDRKGR